MQVWLLDFDKFIKVNNIQEVTNSMNFDVGNVPTPDGLFSTEIFGVSTKDRKENYAYISLGQKFLSPKVYITLKRLNRNFESVVHSTKKYSINAKGELVEDEEKGGTGLKWLYTNWEKLRFPKNESHTRSERVDLITSNKKDILFTDKYIVIPAFYRDVNLQSNERNPRVPEINDLYSKIIRYVDSVKSANNMDFIIAAMEGKIQDTLVDIYNLLKEKIQGKNGYLRRSLLGKTIKYSSRVVISAVPYDTNDESSQPVNYYYTGIPLSHVCSMFTPFIIYWLTRYFKNNFENQKNDFIIVTNKDSGNNITIKLDNPEAFYNSEYIEHHLEKFVKNPYTRFDRIELPVSAEEREKHKLGKKPLYAKFKGRSTSGRDSINTVGEIDSDNGNQIVRDLTWTDLLYRAAVDVTSNKHIWITRYPMLDYFGSYTSRITVLSTRLTTKMIVSGITYDHYPVIDPDIDKKKLDVTFRDTINVSPLYLSGLDGDHDGDQITCKPVFSMEANEECEKILMNKSNLLTIEGKGIRNIGNEGAQTLYSMTKFM